MEGLRSALKPLLLYKGMQPALDDLAGGHIAMMTSPIPLALDELFANIRLTQNHAQVGVELVDDRAWRLGGRHQQPP